MSRLSSWFQRGRGTRSPENVRAQGDSKATSISSPYNIKMTVDTQKTGAGTRAVTVFCGSSTGKSPAFIAAAKSLGKAIAEDNRTLVYGGGSAGIMGIVSGAALEAGGDVVGVAPYPIVAAGGEKEQTKSVHKPHMQLKEEGKEKVELVIVGTMHERKAEMAKRSCAFIGLPGGYGTFEEVLEVVCWSQLGIHSKPVLVVNVCNFWDPLRELIRSGIREGFILEANEHLIRFVEGPADHAEHETFDWGKATMDALNEWQTVAASHFYNWHLRKDGKEEGDTLDAV